MTTIRIAVLKAALLHAGKKDVRYYLNGVLIDRQTGHVVATDGHRMLVAKLADGAWEKGDSYIVPRETLEAAVKLHAKYETIEILDVDTANLTVGHIPCKAIDGRFPEWRRVVPNESKAGAGRFCPRYLGDAFKALAMIAGGRTDPDYATVTNEGTHSCVVTSRDVNAFVVVMCQRADELEGYEYRVKMAAILGEPVPTKTSEEIAAEAEEIEAQELEAQAAE